MKCLKSCPAYDAWLASLEWQDPNPCVTCDHEQEFPKQEGTEPHE